MQASMLSPERCVTDRGCVKGALSVALYDSLIMMIDDEPLNIEVTQVFLEDLGYRRFVSTSDSTQAMSIIVDQQPDILLLDLMMPKITGFDILRQLRSDDTLDYLPSVMLTSATDSQSKKAALELGVTDFLAKPFDPVELGVRIQNTLRAKAYRDSLADYSRVLEDEVRQRTAQLESMQRQMVTCLARAAEYRDDDTGEHVLRVGRYSGILAAELGMEQPYVETLEMAAQLHDIGKIGIPDRILLKPGVFEPHEYAEMKQHSEIGAAIIEGDPHRRKMSQSGELGNKVAPVMSMARSIAATHHERWDGGGYPNGLKGEAIPLEGRIVGVVDVYDALSSERPYKQAMPLEKCLSIIHEGRGSHFDPNIVDTFLSNIDKILAPNF